ncbi:MAG: DNA polymerase II small subunit, partial [Thermococcus sp.]
MLIEDLIKNKYLITPSAYYLLEPHYKRDFTLAELIKFAKARGTFVIDSSIAEAFLAEKGLFSTGELTEQTPLEVSEEEPLGASREETLEEITKSAETPVSETVTASQPEEIPSSENVESAEAPGSISTGDVVESEVVMASSGEESVEPAKIVGKTSISTGATAESEQFPAPNPVEESIS